MNENKLNKIVPLIVKVVDGENLSVKEAEEVFSTIFLYDREGYHFAVLYAAIHAKGETADELLGFCRAHIKYGVKIRPKVSIEKLTDLSGTGGGSLKTFNVSTTASFIVSAAGYFVAKKAFWAITSPTGSADVFAAFGIDVSQITAKKFEKTLENVGICPFRYTGISPKLANRGELARKLERKIPIRTPAHLASNVISPFPMKYRIYGCYTEKYLEVLGELFAKLGYEWTLTVHGIDGLPEVSNVGKTIVVEQKGKDIKRYVIEPKVLGVRLAKINEIRTGGKEANIIDFLRILQGKEKGAKSDLVAVNTGAALYVLGEKKSLMEAVSLSQDILKSGEGYKILERLIREVGDLKLLNQWSEKI